MSLDDASMCGELIARGHAALEQARWDEAQRLFAEAVTRGGSGDALDGLAWAAWWRGDVEGMFEARQRAYRAYRQEGLPRDAARVAGWLGTDLVDFRGELAVAQGWFRRGRSLLEGMDPCPELGWLCVHEAEKYLLYVGDIARARSLGLQANVIGRRSGDVDLEMMGLAMAGLGAVLVGELGEGTEQLGRRPPRRSLGRWLTPGRSTGVSVSRSMPVNWSATMTGRHSGVVGYRTGRLGAASRDSTGRAGPITPGCRSGGASGRRPSPSCSRLLSVSPS